MGWWSSVDCDAFRDETYGKVKMLGNKVRGRNVLRRNERGRIIPVPRRRPWSSDLSDYLTFYEDDICLSF
jgi:hypothetical protein